MRLFCQFLLVANVPCSFKRYEAICGIVRRMTERIPEAEVDCMCAIDELKSFSTHLVKETMEDLKAQLHANIAPQDLAELTTWLYLKGTQSVSGSTLVAGRMDPLARGIVWNTVAAAFDRPKALCVFRVIEDLVAGDLYDLRKDKPDGL